MAHSYTPGLRVTPDTVIRKRRVLSIPGEVLVTEGEQVTATTVVAQTALPGKVYPVNVANKLSITPSEILTYMRKREGETVTKDEAFAENAPFIKWFKTQVRAPISGTLESISHVTGQVFLREPPQVIQLSAYIDGHIVEVTPTHGAVVESQCAFVQGIFGVGGETAGKITLAVTTPDEVLTADHLTPAHQGQIVVGGALAQKEAFARARELGISALVVGGVHDRDLRDLLGYDLGVAITGTEKIGFTLIITEGFGTIPMAKRTFELLAAKSGQQASCSGATQIRAGVIRPEIIIPQGGEPFHVPRSTFHVSEGGIKVGDTIRIIREPYFGAIARIKDLPSELQKIPTESPARVLVATLPDGQDVTIPRANVEMIEE
ncbi:MAG: hypothetical protein FJ147_12175 [Deltaproteobacteria bacterium]|nr:hypothetical protein [Deltaproteobacteria bacterium]